MARKSTREKVSMFLILAIVLVIAWLGGFTLMHVSSGLIHILLLFAIIAVVMHFLTGRRTV
jgi:flagellar biogenesis protein FliO